jgi:peptidoglycan/xylan/chitin deacetylase (PgdA/CDA1 family)
MIKQSQRWTRLPGIRAFTAASILLSITICTAQEYAPDPRWNVTVEKARQIISQVQPGPNVTPKSWPEGKRVAVALTFDLDAELVWMDDPENVSPAELSRGRYGPRAGLSRILALLDRRNIPATFFMPALIVKMHPEAIAAIRKNKRHEIGFHGYGHESVGTLSEQQERQAMQQALQIFKEAGIAPRVYRSPSWDFSSSTLQLLQEFGFRFDSSLMGDDRPYEILAGTQPTGIIELPVDWSLDDWPYFQLEWEVPLPGLRTPGEVLEIWKDEFDGIRSEGGAFILTMHPQVIGRWSRLRMLERLLDHINASGEVWYATLGEIGEHLARSR